MTDWKRLGLKLAAAALTCSCCAYAAAGEVQQKDRVTLDGQDEPIEGKIKKDDFVGVTILTRGAERSVKHTEIKKVSYGSLDPQLYDAMLDKFNAGDYKEALTLAGRLDGRLSAMDATQKSLGEQYLRYYKAMCYFRAGQEQSDPAQRRQFFEKARDGINGLLGMKSDTCWYFEVKLADAECLELISPQTAVSQYNLLVTDFGGKKQMAPWAAKYEFMAKMGVVKLEMSQLVKLPGKSAEITKFMTQLDLLRKSPDWAKYAGSEENASAAQIESMGLLYLKEYAKLIEILNAAVTKALVNDDTVTLQQLYLNRADAFYELSKDASPKQNEYREKAVLDYLQVDLCFSLPVADSAKTNLRIGDLFSNLKNWDDWKRRSLKHLTKAKTLGSNEAEDLMRKVSQM